MALLKVSNGFRKLGLGLVVASSMLLTAISMVSPSPAADFGICQAGKRSTCVVDGDTFWLNGEKVRLGNIDAPEISEAKCAAERRRGEAAKLRLADLLNAGELTWQRQGVDRYGRTLAQIWVNGTDVGATLVAEGLARPYDGGRKPWC